MGGPELAEHLLLIRPETQVLFMSGHKSAEDLKEGMHFLNARFLGKPFNPKSLSEAVRGMLDTCA